MFLVVMDEIRKKFLALPKKVELDPVSLGLPAEVYNLLGSKKWDEQIKKNQTYAIFEQLFTEGELILTGEGKVVRI